MQHAKPPACQIEAAAERIDQAELTGGELDRHRIDREVAPSQIIGDRRGQYARQRAGSLVALRARGRHVDAAELRCLDRGRQEPTMLDDRAAERLGEAMSQYRAVALDDDVEI